jgi:transposase
MSEDERNLIKKLYYRKGFSAYRISKILKYSVSSIYQNVREEKERKNKSDNYIFVEKLYKQNYTINEIVDTTKLCYATVYNYVRMIKSDNKE